MDDTYRHCEALVRAADKDRYLATLFAPADRRGPLYALYAFNSEIAGVRERAREPMPGEIRLQWWRDVLNGERGSEAAANPIAAGLIDTINRFSLPKAALIDLVEAHAFDLYDDPMPTLAALEGYARQTSGTIFELAALICGTEAAHAAEPGGIAYGITSLLRSFALNASRRQLYLPREFLEGGTTPEEIYAGQASRSLVNALGMVRTRAKDQFVAFEQTLATLPAAAMPALLPLALVPGYLSEMERADYDPFRSDLSVPQWRRQWILWRAARRWSRVMR